LCCGCAKLVQRVTGCLTSNPNSTKGKIIVGQGVDLDTTYIKGGKNPRKGTPFLRTLERCSVETEGVLPVDCTLTIKSVQGL